MKTTNKRGMNKSKGKGAYIISGILVMILLTNVIAAFGVAIPYWDHPEWYPLKLAPGESKIVQLTLQNTEPEDVTFMATIDSDSSDIAIIADSSPEYFVPSGEVNKKVNIKVIIPKNAEIGATYNIGVSFKQVSSGEGGMVSVAKASSIKFPVEVVGKEDSELYGTSQGINPLIIYTVLGVLAIGIAAFIIRRRTASKK
jgi:hypothetical protein